MIPKRDKVTGKFVSRKGNKNATEKGQTKRGLQHKITKKETPGLDKRKNTGGSIKGSTRSKK